MTRGRLIASLVVGMMAVALGWALMTTISRVLRPTAPDTPPPSAPTASPATATPAVPRIKARLYYASEDGRSLVGVEQEIPFAEGTVGQARALVEAQLAGAPPSPLSSTIPAGTVLRGLFVTDRHEAFVDLDPLVRDQHPGGSMNELLTVYAIVNVITTNLAAVERVQILIDGREVDTLAGHVDLRRPLGKNESLIAP